MFALPTHSFLKLVLVFAALANLVGNAEFVQGQEEADFYWIPISSQDESSEICHFRKKMTLVAPEKSEVLIAATGPFQLFMNGRLVASGEASTQYASFDAGRFLFPGVNVIAVEVDATGKSERGLALRFRVKEKHEPRWRAMGIDETWLTHQTNFPEWQKQRFRDLGWLPAAPSAQIAATRVESDPLPGMTSGQNSAQLGSVVAGQSENSPIPGGTSVQPSQASAKTIPIVSSKSMPTLAAPQKPYNEDVQREVATNESALDMPSSQISDAVPASSESKPEAAPSSKNVLVSTKSPQDQRSSPQPGPEDEAGASEPRFEIGKEFRIDPVLASDECGSIIAIAFDEWGYLIVSQEGGHLKIADLSIPFGEPRVATLCDEVENCQGILPLNGRLYVTGTGPQGLGLYLLERINPESTRMKVAKLLVKFSGQASEHGPHGLTLGPDGLLYCIIGNGSGPENQDQVYGPYRHPLEIDLTTRLEDPSGHSNGVRAPAGTVLRMTLDGTQVQTVAGGIRNAYDLVFNAHGDLFIHDSDMESDIGLPWYRPTALYHVTDGIDVGWRSGWAKYPYYFMDTVSPVAITDRGSPSGAVCYTHLNFPARYHGALFLADWSEGRVLAVRQTIRGASYTTEVEEFLKGKPLNVTDLDVGEDGALYLATGGRGTSGGVYRVAWTGAVPDDVMKFENDLTRLVRQPQATAPWARQNMAEVFYRNPQELALKLVGVALDAENTPNIRCQAIENLYLFGHLSDQTLATLSRDPLPQIRAKAAQICGTTKKWGPICLPLLNDEFKHVRRRAAEALLRTESTVSLTEIINLMSDDDHVLASTGTRLLERLPLNQWKDTVLKHENPRVFYYGSLSLMRLEPSADNGLMIVNRCSSLLEGFISDRDFVQLLRVAQITLARTKLEPKTIATFSKQMAAEFPTANSLLNRELVRILTYLKDTSSAESLVDYLANHADDNETKILVAMHYATFAENLNDKTRLALIESLHRSMGDNQAGSFRLYLSRSIRTATESLSKSSVSKIIQSGEKWPYALMPVFYRLTQEEMAEYSPMLVDLDRRLQPQGSRDVVAQARLGIIALLAEGKTDIGNEYLRRLWVEEPDRRRDIVIGIAQNPTRENWTYLIASLPIVNDLTAGDILNCIQSVKLRPVDPQHYREIIELGYRLRNDHAKTVSKILAMWTERDINDSNQTWEQQLEDWSKWYHEEWPNEQQVDVQDAQTISVSFQPAAEILDMLERRLISGDAERGLHVFNKADCAKCHRFGANGSSAGPDLTSIAKRFSKRETLESIVEPSKVVSDQYRSTMIVNENGISFVGLKVENNDGTITLIVPSGERVRFGPDEIAEQKFVTQSSMPDGLLDSLTKQEIADLFAFMYNEREAVVAQSTSETTVK
jgi:putative heme-binding domain-containing protein